VALPDGSTMTMNSASEASTRYSYNTRGIVLAKGEALFDVAKNKSRPFDVMARDIKVRAVGTSFAVKSLENAPLEVVVREGVVVVSTKSSTIQLVANRRAVIAQDGKIKIEALSTAEILNALLWRKGYIFFNGSTLADAAQQFSRYSSVRIVFADRAVANRSVSGLFKAADPETFAKATSEALNLRLQQNGNTIQLSKNAD
jgi:transmembrane sensor